MLPVGRGDGIVAVAVAKTDPTTAASSPIANGESPDVAAHVSSAARSSKTRIRCIIANICRICSGLRLRARRPARLPMSRQAMEPSAAGLSRRILAARSLSAVGGALRAVGTVRCRSTRVTSRRGRRGSRGCDGCRRSGSRGVAPPQPGEIVGQDHPRRASSTVVRRDLEEVLEQELDPSPAHHVPLDRVLGDAGVPRTMREGPAPTIRAVARHRSRRRPVRSIGRPPASRGARRPVWAPLRRWRCRGRCLRRRCVR